MIKILLCTIALVGCAVSTGNTTPQQDMAPPHLFDLTETSDLAVSDDMSTAAPAPAQDGGYDGGEMVVCGNTDIICNTGWLCRLGNDCFPPCVVPGAGLVYLNFSDPDAIPLDDNVNFVLPCWVPRCATYGGICPQ